jgi:O-antigen/teichoic acid export membrane protein
VLKIRTAGWLVANQALVGAVAFAASIIIARALGPSGKGTITVAQTITGLASIILAVGLPGAAGYLAARDHVDGRTESKVAWAASLFATALSLAVAIPLAPWLMRTFFESESSTYLWIAIVAIAPTIAGQILGGFLLGVGRIRDAALVTMAFTLANFACLVALDVAGYLTALTFLALWLLFLLGSAFAQTTMLLRMPKSVHSASVMATIRRGARFSAASWASSGLHLLALRIDVLLLTALSGSAAVGVYSVGVTLAEVGWYVPNALYGVLFPKVAAERDRTGRFVAQTARLVWPIVLIVGIVIVLLAELVVVPLYGSQFVGAVGVVALLVPGMTLGGVASVLSAHLAGIGKPGLATKVGALNLTANVAACLVLIPSFEELGAAAASSLSYSCAAALMAFYFIRETRLPTTSILLPARSDLVGLSRLVRRRLAGGR